jgi:hypothetical protein
MTKQPEIPDHFKELIGKVTLFMFQQTITALLLENPTEEDAKNLSHQTMDYVKNTLKVDNPLVALMLGIEATKEVQRMIVRKGAVAITN